MTDLWRRLKQRKLVQWALAYIAAAFALLQGVDIVAQRFGWPAQLERILILALAAGFFVVLVIAWYHGEQGRQRVSSVELLILALVLAIGGGLVWRFGHGSATQPAVVATANGAAQAPRGSMRVADAASSGHHVANVMAQAAPIPAKSVAVLPFENLSTDKGNAYFADGMQDLILTKLADIGDLKVISRTSTQQYASRPDNLKTIGQQLGVATILEGSVQKAGNQVLINVQLIDARTDAHIWAQSYQRNLTNIFGVEGEVAQKVADELKAKLTSAETARVAVIPTTNPAANDAYLQGEYYAQQGMANFSKADFLVAFEHYRKAVGEDPEFALAWARQAYWQLLYLHFIGNDQPGLVASAKAAIDRAFALQPQLEQAYLAQGFYLYYIKSDPAEAAKAFATAHQLKPQDAAAIFANGLALESLGKRDAAIGAYQEAGALDPRQAAPWLNMSFVYLTDRRYTDAERGLKHALAIDPASVFAVAGLTQLYSLTGNLGAMRSLLDAAPAGVKASPVFKPALAQYFIYRRDWSAARTILLGIQAASRKPDWNTECMLGDVERLAGKSAAARSYFQRCADLLPEAIRHSTGAGAEPGSLGLAWVHLGRTREALAQGQRGIAAYSPTSYRGQYALLSMAQIQAQAGMAKDAVANLNRLLSRPASGAVISVPLLRMDPDWDPLRKDPRFQALLKKYAQSALASATSVASAPVPVH